MKLRRGMRLLARSVARESWVESKGCGDTARLIFEQHPRVTSLDPATILMLVQIAIALWKFWQSMKLSEPSETPSETEPVSWEADDDD